jgi:acetyl esterase/lipase
MMKTGKIKFLKYFILLSVAVYLNLTYTRCSHQDDAKQKMSALYSYKISEDQWGSSLLGRNVVYTVYSPDTLSIKKPVVVYLKNLPTPRIGRSTDETLIKDFLRGGMMVFVVDYEKNPGAVIPGLMSDIDSLYIFARNMTTLPIDKDWIYIIPEGYTIDRKIEICKFKQKPVEMDLIYPSDPKAKIPVMLQVTSVSKRGKWLNSRACYVYGLLTTGYACAIMDWNNKIGVVPRGDIFPEKRALRLLRGRAKDWNLSGKVGITGHSKGGTRAALAAVINENEMEAELGPYPEESSRFQVALISAGRHAREFLVEDGCMDTSGKGLPVEELRATSSITFVTLDDPALFLSVGELDTYRTKQMKRLAKRCEEVGLEFRFVNQKGMGHDYNPNPEVIKEIFSFFDNHLK